MSEFSTGGEKRQLAFKKLQSFIPNPGMFCVLVLGARGTGKRFAIQKAWEVVKFQKSEKELENLRLKNISYVSANNFPEDIDTLFEANLYGTIVLEDFDILSNEKKSLLLDALSTIDGKFGIKEKVAVRLVFVTSEKISNLRLDNISNLLWDRISQLLVELPSFQDEASHALKDFEYTWNKMKFDTINKDLSKLPNLPSLDTFLKSQFSSFVGGFRDLDKIACLYFNYRLFHYGENQAIQPHLEEMVLADVKSDFIGKTQMHVEEITYNSIFDFDEVQPSDGKNKYPTLDDYNNQFRIRFRKFLLDKHKTLSKAAENIQCSIHTLKGYKDKSQTKKSQV
jgi:hypothetical protein